MKINLSEYIFPIGYWKEFFSYTKKSKKVSDVLSEFFEKESDNLQAKFNENFDYPADMIEPPVRFNKDAGIIYYVLNFKNPEVFKNPDSKQYAFLQSLKILDENLPIGATEYIVPFENLENPDEMYMFCSFIINKDFTKDRMWIFTTFVLSLLVTVLGLGVIYKLFNFIF